MPSSGILRLEALLITDVSEELSVSVIGVTRTGELATSSETSHDVTSQRTAFFIVIVVKTSNLT
jgi:hypothetical protein